VQQDNSRKDIAGGSAVVPKFSVTAAGGAPFQFNNQIGAMTISVINQDTAFSLSAGNPLTVTIVVPGLYRMRSTFRVAWNASEGGIVGVGFCVNGIAEDSHLIAFQRFNQTASAGAQHSMNFCHTEYYLNAGDTLSFVTLASTAPSVTSSSEPMTATLEFID
jgi:hypothetical protein